MIVNAYHALYNIVLTYFLSLVSFYTPWKHQETPENQRFSDVFKGYRKGPVT